MFLPEASFAARLRVLQIITGVLIANSVALGAAAVFLVAQNGGPLSRGADADLLPVVSIMAVAMLSMCLLVQFILPTLILRAAVQRLAAPGTGELTAEQCAAFEVTLLGMRQTALIVTYALLEGPAILGALAYLLEGQSYTLVGVALAAAVMLARFPTAASLRAWLERQLEVMLELRQFGASSY